MSTARTRTRFRILHSENRKIDGFYLVGGAPALERHTGMHRDCGGNVPTVALACTRLLRVSVLGSDPLVSVSFVRCPSDYSPGSVISPARVVMRRCEDCVRPHRNGFLPVSVTHRIMMSG